MFLLYYCTILSACLGTVLAELLGHVFPAPTDLSSSESKVSHAWADLSTALDEELKHNKSSAKFGNLADANKVTFSASLFSLNDPGASDLQYHWTAPQVANGEQGTNKVDGDSIYRVASVSKLITTFAGMQELTEVHWNTPLSEIFPGLVSASNDTASPIFGVQWDLITPTALASQLSGIPTLGLPQGDLLVKYAILAATKGTGAASLETNDGFPALPFTVFGPCTSLSFACSRDQFIETIAPDSPAQLPWATPGYSDLNFMLLGAVISKYTGKPLDTMYQDFIFDRLDMSSSYANAPLHGSAFSKHSVVVGPINGSWAFAENNPTIPSGGILSTINDLNKLGVGLINSTLLTAAKTRAWLKPHTHTASLTESIGQPWEIIRYVHPSTGKVTDIYTKLGDSGAYGGMVALIPDYGAGWTFLNAYYENPATLFRGEVALLHINQIAEAIIPALEAQAAAEATKNYVGTYVSDVSNLNSSLVIGFNTSDAAQLTLSISEWISNGTDMLNVDLVGFAGLHPYLQPTISDRENGQAGQVAFRASVYSQYTSYLQAGLGPFTGFYASNWDVWTYDGGRYGNQQVQSFVFNVNSEGSAESVFLPSLGVTLKKAKSQGSYIMRGVGG